ncbi:MAG: hypothetical protein JNL72_02495 [Flavipsychrobacter sp.]|nr:hypothetical protein [Flavipsychrobacter sp.]
MKRGITQFVTAALIAMGSATATFAQEKSAAPAFDKGSSTIGVWAGFGLSYGYYMSPVELPSFGVLFDHGIVGNVGPGTIGVGGIIGMKNSYYNYSFGGYRATWRNYIVAARATYHLTLLKDKNNKFDPYAGIVLGVRISDYNDTYYTSSSSLINPYSYNNVSLVRGVFVGAKYNFTKNFGAFAELGYDISLARIGLNFNFGK